MALPTSTDTGEGVLGDRLVVYARETMVLYINTLHDHYSFFCLFGYEVRRDHPTHLTLALQCKQCSVGPFDIPGLIHSARRRTRRQFLWLSRYRIWTGHTYLYK